MGPKIAIVNSSALEKGAPWTAEDHIQQTMKLSHWEHLKDIATRRRRLMKMMSNLDDEEQRVRSEIELQSR